MQFVEDMSVRVAALVCRPRSCGDFRRGPPASTRLTTAPPMKEFSRSPWSAPLSVRFQIPPPKTVKCPVNAAALFQALRAIRQKTAVAFAPRRQRFGQEVLLSITHSFVPMLADYFPRGRRRLTVVRHIHAAVHAEEEVGILLVAVAPGREDPDDFWIRNHRHCARQQRPIFASASA